MPIAANLINGKTYENKKGDKIENITIGGDKDNVYCYTFAAPNTFYSPDNKFEEQITLENKYEGEWREPKGNKYRCIFNIVNDDDFVPKVPMKKCEIIPNLIYTEFGWTKYGQETHISIEKDITKKLYGPQLNHSYYEYIFNIYKSNIAIADAATTGLGAMYLGTNNMRRDTYDFGLNFFNVTLKPIYDLFDAEYTKPFQKKLINIQQQTPAYLMMNIAYAMHEKDENGNITKILNKNINQLNFAKRHFANEFQVAKLSLLFGSLLGEMEKPHYVESYYTLTKEVSALSFR